MKKKLQQDITSLANRILSEKGDLNPSVLKESVLKLYNRLVILEYLETQLRDSAMSPEQQSLDSKSFREENWFIEPEPVPQPENTEELIEPLMEKIKDIVAQMPDESRKIDEMLDEMIPKKNYMKNDLEEFASAYQQTPTFERKEPSKGGAIPKKTHTLISDIGAQTERKRSINDKLNQGLQIGLNDRLAFIKHLFNGDHEAYTASLKAISSCNSFKEAEGYLQKEVRPQFDQWDEKAEYAERFLLIIEKNFS